MQQGHVGRAHFWHLHVTSYLPASWDIALDLESRFWAWTWTHRPVACCACLPAWLPVSGVTGQLIIILRLTIFHLPEKEQREIKREREGGRENSEKVEWTALLFHLMKERACCDSASASASRNVHLITVAFKNFQFFIAWSKGKVVAIWWFILPWHLPRNYWQHSDCRSTLYSLLSFFCPVEAMGEGKHKGVHWESRRVNNDGHVLQNVFICVCVCESTFFSLHHTHTHYVYVMSHKLSRHTRPACSVDSALAQPCHKSQSQKVWLPAHKSYSAGRGTCGQAGWRVDWVNTFYRPAQLGDNLWNEAKWSEIKINFICA